jgi:hypothetical protein
MFNVVYGNNQRHCENRAKQASAEFHYVVALVHIVTTRIQTLKQQTTKLSDRITFTEKSITGAQFWTMQMSRISLEDTRILPVRVDFLTLS